jgi:uncharacterized membrane protein YbhN (UPF0104 family)
MGKIRSLSPKDLALITLINFFFLHSQGVVLKFSTQFAGLNLKAREWLGIFIVSLATNYLIPFAGIGLRAQYLKMAKGFSYSDFAVASSLMLFLELLVFSGGGLIGYSLLYSNQESPNFAILAALLLPFVGTIIVFTVNVQPILVLFSAKIKVLRHLESLLSKFYKAKKNRPLLLKLFAASIYMFAVNALFFYAVFRALQLNVPAASNLLVAAISDFSFFFRIAPAAVGTYDASIVWALSPFSKGVIDGLLASNLARFSTLLVLIITVPICLLMLPKRFAKAPPVCAS